MKDKLSKLSRKYMMALKKHLAQGTAASLRMADGAGGFGQQAMAIGLETLGLTKIHENALMMLLSSNGSSKTKDRMIKRAGDFFAEAIAPMGKTHRTALESNTRLKQLNKTLHQRTVELAAANRQLKQKSIQNQAAEKTLRETQQHYVKLLADSYRMQEQLRLLSHRLLSAQEEERKKISRELHDEIAQTLTGINVHLAALKVEATVNTKDLKKKIASTQHMVEKSVDIVHRFARELRPTVLDDLGLIPALHSYMRDFMKQTGIRIHFSAFAGVEQLRSSKRTIVYRIAQSALTNIAKHAKASQGKVSIKQVKGFICLEINDNGKGFEVERTLFAKRYQRLGLIGMRERVEMVGGRFAIESAPGQGTTIRATIPFVNGEGDRD